MHRIPPLLAAALLVGAAFLSGGPALASPDGASVIYRWVDTDGIAHYTTDLSRVPGSLQARAAAASTSGPAAETPGPRHSTDVWADRDRPPEANAGEALGEADFGVDAPERRARVLEIDGQIEGLLQEIAADEETLKQRIVGPDANPLTASADDEMRAAASRLPQLLETLRSLREERSTLEAR